MGPVCGPVVLLLGFLSSQALAVGVKVHMQPMVAFVSGKPAMKHTANGWVADENTGYLSNKKAIWKFCKHAYPDLDVSNIVEMNVPLQITNWCIKDKDCTTEKVIPYRCLVGEFQSDALLVPERCQFDHVHDKKKCQSHDAWKKVAEMKCASKTEKLSRYAMLKPCKTDMFEGVEYVCCPTKGDTTQKVVAPKDVAPHKVSKDMKKHMQHKKKQHTMMRKMHKNVEGKKQHFDSYQKYKHWGLKSNYDFEHQKFTQALETLEETNHEKVTAVMKEWANARDRIQQMKSTDPKGASRMEKEVTERFKKTYQALDQESHSEKNNLLAEHEQHILSNINEKKRKALDHLTEALNDKNPDAEVVIKYFQRYIRAEGKDREHTIKHFAHVRKHQPKDVETVRQYTLKHLKQIEDRVNESVQLIERIDDKRLVMKIKKRVHDFMAKYHKNMDDKLTKSLLKPTPAITDKAVVEKYRSKLREDAKQEKEQAVQVDSNKIIEAKEDAIKSKKVDVVVPPEKKVGQPIDFPEDVDDETYEDEHLYLQPQHNAALKNTIDLQENELFVSKKETKNIVPATSTTVGIVVGALTAFVIIIIAIVMVRRRSQRSPADSGFIEVSQAVSPEEKHVQNMQSDGYENPTYKFFELQGQ